MIKVQSRQKLVKFVWCESPITINKSWGFQDAPDGAFLKLNNELTEVSHLVQPNADKSAPVGWIPSLDNIVAINNLKGFFDKAPIWVSPSIINNQVLKLKTLDGEIPYDIKEPSVIVCNGIDEPDFEDCWVMKLAELQKNYEVEEVEFSWE